MATDLDVFLEGSMMGLALLLTLVAAISAKRGRSKRAAIIALGLAALAAKGALLLAGVVEQDTLLDVLDLAVVSLLYASLMAG